MDRKEEEVDLLRARIVALEVENLDLRARNEPLMRDLQEKYQELRAEVEYAVGKESGNQPPPARGSDEERRYLASRNGQHFHRPGCEWANEISPYNLIEFGSHREAVEANYKPCKTCRA
jgi:hypothetical protein